MNHFLEDFATGLTDGRYIEGALPELPVDDNQFDLALCANFLFLYSDQLSQEFHLQSLRELCRVAEQVRIFPLHDLSNQPSIHLDSVAKALSEDGYDVQQQRVNYEFRHGSVKMLNIKRR
jgi:ubiquinone/menaquinone biosynthesis C-methylase UbiE